MQDAKNKFNTKKNRLRESHSNYRFSQAALFISLRPGTQIKITIYMPVGSDGNRASTLLAASEIRNVLIAVGDACR